MKNQTMSSVDINKINKGIINFLWLIILAGSLVYVASMLTQEKELSLIIKNVAIFVVGSSSLNLISTIVVLTFKNKLRITKYFLATTYSFVIPIYTYISLETNHEVWILSFVYLLIFILYMDVGLIIYVSIINVVINVVTFIVYRDIFLPEFFNARSEILIRLFAFVWGTFFSVYTTNLVNKIFNRSKTTEDEIKDDKESALKTLSVVKELSESIKSLGEKNNQISKRLMTASESQASSVEQISASTEELMASIEEISKNATHASEDMNNIVNEVQVGMNSLKGSSLEMVELVKFSKMMIESIESINEIAENTNLLALNAAIEAARAGDAGKGFAVVATEIRKLAEKSTTAAHNVGDLLKESKIKISNGANLNNKVNEIFTKISEKLENISKVFQQISFATQELDKGGKEISNGLEVINQASTENLELSKEIEVVNNNFDKDSKKLNQVIKSNRKLGLELVEAASKSTR